MKKIMRMSPLLFTILGLGLMSFVTFKQFQQERPLLELIALVFVVVFYVSYLVYESRISFKEMGNEVESYDYFSMELAALVKIGLLISCLGGGPQLFHYPLTPMMASIGILFMLFGFYIRSQSIKDLGEQYTHKIRPIKKEVHDKGVYSVIRHGAYAGTFVIHLGVVLAFLNTYSLVMLFLWFGIVLLRVVLEERLLMQDPRYLNYSKKTRYKLIPRIW